MKMSPAPQNPEKADLKAAGTQPPSGRRRRARVVRWGLFLAFLLIAVMGVRSANSFLCADRPVRANVLIVEGWLPDYAMTGAIQEFRRGSYKYILTSGGTLSESWLSARFKTYAEVAAADLAALGLETNVIVAVPAPKTSRDRTYSSAMAVREWLEKNAPVTAVNVYTLGPHARRTRLLFEKALGGKVTVGILAHPDESYDQARWWASADGFQNVVGETIAYVYARLLFHPQTLKDTNPV